MFLNANSSNGSTNNVRDSLYSLQNFAYKKLELNSTGGFGVHFHNDIIIVDQVIAPGALVGCLFNSIWGE